MYYVSVIIQDKNDSRAWRCSDTDGCTDYDSAKELVEKYRSQHTVLAAWIIDNVTQKMRFFKCYVDIVGQVSS